jgi:hypothetical protein
MRARKRLDAIEEERVVGRVMDVRFADRRIDAQLVPVLNTLGACVMHDQLIDLLPRLPADAFDVVRERGLCGYLERMSEATKAQIRARVGQMEGELLVTESVHLLDEGGTQHDLRGQARTAEIAPVRARVALQVFPDQLSEPTIGAQDLVDRCEFARKLVRQNRTDEQIKSRKNWAHPGAPCSRAVSLLAQ